MATPSALATLIDLANKETEAAARRLGDTIRLREEAAQKLDLLTQYRDDYALRCQASLASGIGATQFNNFQVFMAKLDQAIAGQQQVVADAARRADQARTDWIACEQKKMSYVTLNTRAERAEIRLALKRDQKQNDEYAARSAIPKSTPH
jgi:flagellar FliJ protein